MSDQQDTGAELAADHDAAYPNRAGAEPVIITCTGGVTAKPAGAGA